MKKKQHIFCIYHPRFSECTIITPCDCCVCTKHECCDEEGDSWRKGYELVIAKERERAFDIIHKYMMKTKDLKTFDLLEKIQKEIL